MLERGVEVNWLQTVLQVLNLVEDAIGYLPRFDGNGKMVMPENPALPALLELTQTPEVANALFAAACHADPTLHSAVTVAALNCQEPDKARLLAALKGV